MEEKQFYLLIILVLASINMFKLDASDVVLYESFEESFEGRWIVSRKDAYKGVWEHFKSDPHDDYGLLVSQKAKKYAIVRELDRPLSFKDGTLVLQFEIRLKSGLECGGAYLKYLQPQERGWKPEDFDSETPYSIMFGPDKCGSMNKVQFILNHKNPKSGEYIEHHLKFPPGVPSDKLTHVYTAILNPDNELVILIDGKKKRQANLLKGEDFEPPIIPAKRILSSDDKKPNDWVVRAQVPDLSVVKPNDLDEVVLEDNAVKPDKWLDDEQEEIGYPEASMQQDWDDEENGDCEPPAPDNVMDKKEPGCGECKISMKRPPAYRGKWHCPLTNKGIWIPRAIPNPEYFEIDKLDFEPIVAVGVEIWTMQDGILFDNILIATNEVTAKVYRDKTWRPKFQFEKEKKKAEKAAASKRLRLQRQISNFACKIAYPRLLKASKACKFKPIITRRQQTTVITVTIICGCCYQMNLIYEV